MLNKRLGVNIRIIRIRAQINLDVYSTGEIEIAVQRAGAMTRGNGGNSGEFVDPGCAGCGTGEASLDAVAFAGDLRVLEVDFGGYPSDVETADVYEEETES